MPRQFVFLVLIAFSPHVSALRISGGALGRASNSTDKHKHKHNHNHKHSPRVVVQQDPHRTGGPEALVQLMLAFQDIGAQPFYIGSVNNRTHHTYPELRIEGRDISVDELRPDDIVIVPESKWCFEFNEGWRPYIWLLANKNKGPDSCRRISHNHFLANKIGTETLTPYITPSIVTHAKLTTGLELDGRFNDFEKLLTLKKDIVLIDDDAGVPARIPSDAGSALMETGESFKNKLISELQRSYSNIQVVQISSFAGNGTLKTMEARSGSDPSGIIVQDISRKKLLELMTQAKVVVDTCMVGSERMPLEAALHGAVAITDFCGTGSDDIDFPTSRGHKVNGRSNIFHAIVKAVRDYPTEVMDEGQVALRKRYGSDIGRASLAKEAQQFLHAIAARTVAQ